MWPSRLLMAHIQYTEKRSIFFHLNVELENRETERENYKKTTAVYSESLSEKSISSFLVFDSVTIAADRPPNTGKYCHNSSLNSTSC